MKFALKKRFPSPCGHCPQQASIRPSLSAFLFQKALGLSPPQALAFLPHFPCSEVMRCGLSVHLSSLMGFFSSLSVISTSSICLLAINVGSSLPDLVCLCSNFGLRFSSAGSTVGTRAVAALTAPWPGVAAGSRSVGVADGRVPSTPTQAWARGCSLPAAPRASSRPCALHPTWDPLGGGRRQGRAGPPVLGDAGGPKGKRPRSCPAAAAFSPLASAARGAFETSARGGL